MIKKNNLNIALGGFITASIVGIVILLMKFVGFSTMDPGNLLGVNNSLITLPYFFGWIIYYIIEITMAFVFVFLWNYIPGNTYFIKGLIFGFLLFLVGSITVIPLAGLEFFLGFKIIPTIENLIVHELIGVVLGFIINKFYQK